MVARTSRPGPGSATAAEVVAEMAAEAATLVTGAGIDRTRLLGFGLVFPGPLAPAGVSPPSMRQWLEYPLGEELRRVTGRPVLVENDAAAAALGELWSGGAGTSATFAAVYMGTGIGAACWSTA
nr:ROK family protein [Amycolatopsis sp. MtRt-6]